MVILTGVVVINAINTPDQSRLAVFKTNVATIQEAVNTKMSSNRLQDIEKRNNNVKWVGVVSGYTIEDIDNEPVFNNRINGVDTAALDISIKDSLSISDEEFSKYYVARDGKVYHTGFLSEGITYYNIYTMVLPVEKLELTQQPTKTVYKQGDVLDISGLVVTATYNDQTTADVVNCCTFTPSLEKITQTVGTKEIKVSYMGKNVEMEITVNHAENFGELNHFNYGENVNYTANGKSDWKIYYSTDEYVFLIASTSIGKKTWKDALPNASEVTKVNDNTQPGYTGNLYKIMKLGQEGYTLNSQYNDDICIADLVNNYGAYANTSAYVDAKGNSYIIGAIGGPTMELIEARANIIKSGAIKVSTNTYGYEVSSLTVSTGLPISSSIWIASPHGAKSKVHLMTGRSGSIGYYYAYLHDDLNVYVCPVVCIKSNIPSRWNGSSWEI